jgi:hypothetical protein
MPGCLVFREPLIKSFDKLRTNGKLLIPFMVSLSNYERNQLIQSFLRVILKLPAIFIVRIIPQCYI